MRTFQAKRTDKRVYKVAPTDGPSVVATKDKHLSYL